jgi:hypothetical protein
MPVFARSHICGCQAISPDNAVVRIQLVNVSSVSKYLHRKNRKKDRPLNVLPVLAGAGIFGAIIGVASVATTQQGRENLTSAVKVAAVAVGATRSRPPQQGDYWGGCNDARAAGTAPIYRGEPGYRPEMDGDNDGVACEPYRQ